MPIPTDTYHNIKVLNWVFAASALLLLAVMGLSVVQDYHKSWRDPQISNRVWEAALVDDKLRRVDTPQHQQELKHLDESIKAKQAQIDANSAKVNDLKGRIARIRSDTATLEFGLNNRKAELMVQEAELEQAKTVAATDEDRQRVRDMEQRIRAPRQRVADETEQVKAWGVEVEKVSEELGALTRDRDVLEKEKTKLLADQTALNKKRDSLMPRRLDAKLSAQLRRIPLMQFINPSEKVTQDVLPDIRTDVAFQKITTIDRCRTCHVNIEDKNFTEENVLAFLERNVAESRQMTLPAARPTRATDPQATADQPGAAAMGEFWHAWALEIGAPAVRRNAARIKSVADSVGKGVTVTVDGRPVPAFAYDLNAALAKQNGEQNTIFVNLLRAWARFPEKPGAEKNANAVDLTKDRVRVQITHGAANAAAARAAALKYPEDVRSFFDGQLQKEQRRLLYDRYRRDLTAVVNDYRDGRGYPALDEGRVILAHPNLDLYVSVDSKHSYEKVGCTSCHDGSGQETDFVLTAHTARDIWVDQKTGAAVLPEQVINPPEEHHTPTLASMLESVYPHDALVPLGASSLHMPLGRHAEGHAEVEKGSAPQAGRPDDAHANVQLASADEGAGAAAVAKNPAKSDKAAGGSHGKAHAPKADDAPVNYRDPVTGRTGRAVPQIRYWARKYELESGDSFDTVHHRWDWPMRSAEHIEANCVRCHTQVGDIREYAPTLNEGRTLFATIGCANCHQMDSIPVEQKRQVGTDLRHVADKLSPAFINTWVWAPKAFRPSTKMPHFFMLENNSSDEELRRTRQEVRAITEYLVRSSTPMPERHPLPPAGKGSADAGRQVFETVGCQGCHVNLNAPTKTRGVTVAQQWITQDLIKGGRLAEQLEPVVAQEVRERMTRDVESTAQKAMEASVTSTVTAAVTKELTPARPAGSPRATPAEQAELKARITAEVQKRLPAELEKARAGLPAAVAKARADLPAAIERAIPTELTRRVADEAKAIYDRMSYNERQLYCTENFEPRTVVMEPRVALAGQTPERTIYDVQLYPDGTPKPIFMHHGPELSGIGTKLLAGRKPEEARAWVFAWLREPHHYSSYTLMPNLRLTDQQALDLVEYLLAQTREANKPGDAWKADVTPPDEAKVAELVAFFLRSRFSVKTAEQKAVEEFTTDASGRQADGEITRLAVDALTTPATPKEEAAAKVKQLKLVDKQMVWLGKKLISHYGCMSCHQINGMENSTATGTNLSDWGQKGLDKLDFAYLDHHKAEMLPDTSDVPMVNGLSEQAAVLAFSPAITPDGRSKVAQPVSVAWPHVGHSREDWITQKLSNTRIYDRGKSLLEPKPESQRRTVEDLGKPYDKLRMPTFYLSEKQVDAIVTFVISNRDRLVTDTITMKGTTDESRQIAYGRYLTQKYNCVSCHPVEGGVCGPSNAPPVQQYYAREDLTTKAPPSLRGEGNKIRHDWLFNFLKNVEPLRPLPQIRMPSFHFDSDAEVTAIATYFAAVSNKEAREIRKNLDVVLAYTEPKKSAGAAAATPAPVAPSTAPSTQPAKAPAPPAKKPWYVEETLEAQRKFLETWVLNNKQLLPLQLDPARNNAADLAKSYATLLFKAGFTADLYNAPFPFAEDSRPVVSQDRLRKGEQLFYEMQCLKCHMFGEGSTGEKAPPSVVAPNLAMANDRLQRRWVRHWVQEPPIIQVGTAMPPFLSGLAALKLDGLSWPRAQQLNPQETQRIEQAYGADPNEQAALLLDFLYWAGARNITLTQPQAGAGAPSALGNGPAPLPQGAPPTATQPASAGDPSVGRPVNAAGNPAPVQPGTNVVPPEQKQQMQNPVRPDPNAGARPQAAVPPPATGQPPAPAAAPSVPTQKPATTPAAPAGAPSVTGKVVFSGEAPEPEQIDMAAVKECAMQHPDGAFAEQLVVNDNKTLRNVVVSVTAGLPEGTNFPAPPPAKLDQKGCQYHPHVLAVMKDQPLLISNSDPFLHNVHSLATQNPAFNFGQPNVDPGRAVDPMKAAEVFKIKCDVHPWMGAFVHVTDHPFFSVTGEDGSFALRGLPPGTYTLTAWHETLGTRTAEVKVEEGKPASLDFTFDAQK
jgi:cytochrome c551/c552